MLSVIILQYNNSALTVNAIRSLREQIDRDHEIILVDNASREVERQRIPELFSDVLYIQNETNEGFGKANNRAARQAKGDILLFLNNDTIATSDFVSPVMEAFSGDSSIGIIGPRMRNRDETFQLSCGSLPSFVQELQDKVVYRLVGENLSARRFYERKFSVLQEVEWVTGAALFIRKDLFFTVGGFDEEFFMFFEDKDLCFRARGAGKIVLYDPIPSLVHLKGGSTTSETASFIERTYRKSQEYYYRKHRPVIEQLLLRVYLTFTGKG